MMITTRDRLKSFYSSLFINKSSLSWYSYILEIKRYFSSSVFFLQTPQHPYCSVIHVNPSLQFGAELIQISPSCSTLLLHFLHFLQRPKRLPTRDVVRGRLQANPTSHLCWGLEARPYLRQESPSFPNWLRSAVHSKDTSDYCNL